ncbi:LysR family transcriptional regulator [Pseudomonas prosekii]|uniref:LysR family transcriptional regulator n=1 Tax=Pseudomonas prosekii TaxID=1148509 RepID=UPI00387B334F
MNPLTSLVTFASVVEHRSFSRAAEHLGTTNSSVSKQIAKLEAHLKIKLLHRSTRTLAPTDAGNLIYQHCVRIVKEAQAIHTMLDEWQANPSGALKVIASAAIGRSFLSTGLPAFFASYPDIQLELTYSESLEDLSAERFDIAFLVTDAPPARRVARRLTEIDYVLCCSPDYLVAQGTPRSLSDLQQHNCLLFNNAIVSRPSRWTFTDAQQQTSEVDVRGNTLTNDSDALLNMAQNGTGIALLPHFVAYDALRKGLLVRVLESYTVHNNQADSLFAVYQASPVQPPKIRAFLDFFQGRFDAYSTLPCNLAIA